MTKQFLFLGKLFFYRLIFSFSIRRFFFVWNCKHQSYCCVPPLSQFLSLGGEMFSVFSLHFFPVSFWPQRLIIVSQVFLQAIPFLKVNRKQLLAAEIYSTAKFNPLFHSEISSGFSTRSSLNLCRLSTADAKFGTACHLCWK